jgi:outer membrane immunogenic protein
MAMIRRFVLSMMISIGCAPAAGATDLPSNRKSPPPPPLSAYNWTGLFAGLNAGYGWGSGGANLQMPGTVTTDLAPAVSSGALPTFVALNRSGFIGGGQIGYNYQISALVLGVEADVDGARVNGASNIQTDVAAFNPVVISAGSTLNWLGTARARLGITPVDRWLVYATGGLAYCAGHQSYVAASNGEILASGRTIARAGWTIGAGLEWAFADNWSVKAEYLYYNLGSSCETATPSANELPFMSGHKISNKFTDTGDVARFGVNYKFF